MDINDQLAQAEEVESLQSIYLDEELKVTKTDAGHYHVSVLVPIELPPNYKVRFLPNPNDATPCFMNVNHLPPVVLKIKFRKRYPSITPPICKVTCEWLTKENVMVLQKNLNELWKQNLGFPVIYTWVEYIKTETLTALGLTDELNLTGRSEERPRRRQQRRQPRRAAEASGERLRLTRPVIEVIESFNREKEIEDFMKSHHQCEICLMEKLGKDSTRFGPCGHIFCQECLKSYFTVLVNEGSSTAVKCPAYKCDSEATQKQVREVLPTELFNKYDRALLSTMLDTMSDIVYCPRSICHYPVTWDPEEKVAMCPQCRYAFCIYCRMGYHGVEPCRFKADERREMVECYQNASPAEKLEMENRYGKKQLETMVNTTLTEYWIKDNSKHCPKCNIVIEKSDGCNKMTCNKCQTFFCWLCGKPLDVKSPYSHYMDPKSPCNNRLFLLPPDEMDDWEWGEAREWDEDSGSEDMEGEDPDTDTEH